jgi:hypothetical protein
MVMLMLTLPVSRAAAQTTASQPAATETYPEMPDWTRQLRRAEIIAFGAFPFAVFLSSFALDTYRWATNNWNTAYAPWPLKTGNSTALLTDEEYGQTLLIAAGVSVVVALADFIIVRVKQRKAERLYGPVQTNPPEIKREPLFPIQTGDTPPPGR